MKLTAEEMNKNELLLPQPESKQSNLVLKYSFLSTILVLSHIFLWCACPPMFSQVDVPLASSVSTYSGFPCFVCISLSGVVYAIPCAFISVLNAPKLLNTTEHFSLLESRPLNSNSCTAKSKLGVSKSFSSVPYQSVALFNKTLAVQPPTVIVGNGFVSVGVILILCCLNVGFP